MRSRSVLHRSLAAIVSAALICAPGTAIAQKAKPKPQAKPKQTAKVAQLPAGAQRPTQEVLLSIGQGELITLPANVSSVWTSNPEVADVYVNNPRQIHL